MRSEIIERLEAMRPDYGKASVNEAIDLLNAADKITPDMDYWLRYANTVEFREVFTPFGEYLEKDPPYPFRNAVNLLDSVRHQIKLREAAGCWTPTRPICDCPACGGDND